MKGCDVGLIGLAVMGQNLALNMADKGFRVAVYNRTKEKTLQFIKERSEGLAISYSETVGGFVSLLKKPRVVFLMVKAGDAVDEMIKRLIRFLEPNDLIVDCGNSFFKDTERRFGKLREKGILYMGVGISGGEEGALRGPSIMPGGSRRAYSRVKKLFEAISARVNGEPCVTYIGPSGAGHYVKMVHNGLEYGDIQLLAEAYDILHRGGGLSYKKLAEVFSFLNTGPLSSYLIEITIEILKETDPETGKPILDVILDKAEQKGTGEWTSKTALELKEPIPTIISSVEARNLSLKKVEREKAERVLLGPEPKRLSFDEERFDSLAMALYCAKISLYSQGLSLLRAGSIAYGYGLDISELARIWRGGCIIRSSLLEEVQRAFSSDKDLPNFLMDKKISRLMNKDHIHLRKIINLAISSGIPCPALCASLAYYDSYRSGRLPTNLIQAQRDYFGAHTFERVDKKGRFHHRWESPGEKRRFSY